MQWRFALCQPRRRGLSRHPGVSLVSAAVSLRPFPVFWSRLSASVLIRSVTIQLNEMRSTHIRKVPVDYPNAFHVADVVFHVSGHLGDVDRGVQHLLQGLLLRLHDFEQFLAGVPEGSI